jgi:hypothetical protein
VGHRRGRADARAPLSADNLSFARIAGGRVALLVPVGHGNGQRPVVLEPAAGGRSRIVFRGPPAGRIDSLDFDGRHVAWSSAGCQLVATAAPGSSRATVPAGPCVRTEVWVTTFSPPLARRGAPAPLAHRAVDRDPRDRPRRALAHGLVLLSPRSADQSH